MHLAMLDMGKRKYGDATFCEIDGVRILVDGGHRGDETSSDRMPRSIPDQLGALTGISAPYHFDLLVITHCHSDHIGCIPELIATGKISATWALIADPGFGFGLPFDESFPSVPTGNVERVAAALQEEPLPASASTEEIQYLIDAAATLQERYAGLLANLQAKDTKIVRYGRDPHFLLENAFEPIGLKILGPTLDQLLICAYRIERERRRTVVETEALADTDDEVALYRALVQQSLADEDVLEDGSVGAALNNQSIVLKVGVAGKAALLTGDMQFAAPGVGRLSQRMAVLRQTVMNAGPYAFVRLSHHGASNGTDAALLDGLNGTGFFGISTGADDPGHPSKSVLELLESRQDGISWARTDLNGLVSLRLDASEPKFEIERGVLNDAGKRQPVHIPSPPPTQTTTTHRAASQSGQEAGEGTRLTALPKLTFVTNSARLREKIGDGAEQAINLIRAARHSMIDLQSDLPPHEIAQLARGSSGVVLLGGYDVVPAYTADALPKSLRSELRNVRHADPDNYVVWTDDVYGDVQGLGLPELPVSRIPDGGDPAGVLRALSSLPGSGQLAFGLRNVHRPFADDIFAAFAGGQRMHLSEPTLSGHLGSEDVDAQHVYLMLHGCSQDGTTFRGELVDGDDDFGGYADAFMLADVPSTTGAVILAGCCYGALIAKTLANDWRDGPAMDRDATESLAVAFVHAGARAFIGATGQHYSPKSEPYNTASGPLHQLFWKHILLGRAPAVALLRAKIDYVFEMPYDGNKMTPPDYKTWRQFTCLGLGW